MTADEKLIHKITKYGKQIKRKEKIGHALSRLNSIDMTLDILSATNIGRCVNKLCHDPIYGDEAFRIIEKWKEVARRSGICGSEEECVSENDSLQEYEQSSSRNGVLNGIGVEETYYDEEINDKSYERGVYSGGNTHARVRNKDHENELVNGKRRKYDENKRDTCDRSDSDSERYRRRYDDKSSQRCRSGSSRRSYEDHSENRNKDKYNRKRMSEEADEPVESGDDYNSHSPEWREHSVDEHSGNEVRSSDEEYRSKSLLNNADSNEDLSSCEDDRTARISAERQSSSRSGHKRKRSHSNELRSSPGTKSKTAISSVLIPSSQSKPVHAPVLPAITSKVNDTCKKVVPDFGTMLLSAESSKTKCRKARVVDWKCTEATVLNNYQPFPHSVRIAKELTHPPIDHFNTDGMFKPRNERGKVFAGRRRIFSKDVLSLFNLCLRVLFKNSHVLQYAEYINYSVVKPILEKCTPDELANIEAKHRYLEEDSEELWRRFVEKKYPREELKSHHSWKKLYYFLENKEEEKLKQLSSRIKNAHHFESMSGHRKAILADATAPSYVKRRQIRHGTTHVSTTLPDALEVSSARRSIFETGGSKDALASLPQALVKSNPTFRARTEKKKLPVKKGALMIKTLKMLKTKRR